MTSGIYVIENTLNGKCYVGSGTDLQKRRREHFGALRRGSHHCSHLQRAFCKYGESAFTFEILEEWEPEFLVGMEQWWMNMLRPGYNTCPAAKSVVGIRRSDETKTRMSLSRIGYKPTPETRAKISKSRKGKPTGLKGHKASAETRAKLSISHKGKKQSAETIAKRAAAMTGKKLNVSPQERTRRAEWMRGLAKIRWAKKRRETLERNSR